MLKRQRMGETMGTPVQMDAVVGMLAASDPEVPPETWCSYRQIGEQRQVGGPGGMAAVA